MERFGMQDLLSWKDKENKKPLIIRGARQVGKTWLMKSFGEQAYDQTIYINFENNIAMKELFNQSLDVQWLISGIEVFAGQKIDPNRALLIFDEVQEVPRALTSLKYFHENAPQYQIVCAGSLLGVALHEGTSFPVGKVDFLDLYPLTFMEFLNALGKDSFVHLIDEGNIRMAMNFQQELIFALKQYLFVGGMPEAVKEFAKNQDYAAVRNIQETILQAYEQDFSKHAPNDVVPRIRMLWNSIPTQLAKENKKFIYGLIREGSRAKEYEMAMLWLSDCGLIHKIHRVSTPGIPLKAYEDLKAFKLFMLDVGLLSCMVRLQPATLLERNDLFTDFKGALTEQYVLQQLITKNHLQVHYWTNARGTAEIDFLLEMGGSVYPLEVKAETNLKAKSLKTYYEKYNPPVSVRISMAGYKKKDWLFNLPLWAIDHLQREIVQIIQGGV